MNDIMRPPTFMIQRQVWKIVFFPPIYMLLFKRLSKLLWFYLQILSWQKLILLSCLIFVSCLVLTIWFFFSDLRKVYPYYFTFTTFTKGRWVGERILDVFAREFRAHPAEEYVRKTFIFFNMTWKNIS